MYIDGVLTWGQVAPAVSTGELDRIVEDVHGAAVWMPRTASIPARCRLVRLLREHGYVSKAVVEERDVERLARQERGAYARTVALAQVSEIRALTDLRGAAALLDEAVLVAEACASTDRVYARGRLGRVAVQLGNDELAMRLFTGALDDALSMEAMEVRRLRLVDVCADIADVWTRPPPALCERLETIAAHERALDAGNQRQTP